MEAAGEPATGKTFWRLADQAFFSKVLPRIRGEQTPLLEHVLGELHALFTENNMEMCQAKLESMRESLSASGVARFWA
jgi:hypothetical protein